MYNVNVLAYKGGGMAMMIAQTAELFLYRTFSRKM